MIKKIKLKFQSEDNKRLLSNFLSLLFLQGANYILPLITFPYLVRVLGVEKFGLLAFASAFIAYFSILTDYGFNLTATREISIYRDNQEKIEEIFSSVMTIKFILMVISFIIMSAIIFTFPKFKNDYMVYFLTFGIVIGQVLFPQWFFQGMERMKYITFLNILAKVIFTIAIFVFIHNANDYLYVPLLNSFGFIIAGVLALWIVFRDFKIKFHFQSFNTLKYYFIDGWHLFLSSFFGNFYRNFNTLVLGVLTNNLYVGYYSIAEKVVKIIQMLQSVIGNTLFPYFSKKFHKNSKEFFYLTNKYFKWILLGYGSVVLLLFILAPYIIFLIKGNYESDIITNLKIMSIVVLIGGLNYYLGVLGLITLGYKREFTQAIIYTGIFNIIICWELVYIFKDTGASWSFVLSEGFLLILLIFKMKNIKKGILNE